MKIVIDTDGPLFQERVKREFRGYKARAALTPEAIEAYNEAHPGVLDTVVLPVTDALVYAVADLVVVGK